MGLFEQWPYTNLHTLNLDWILESLKVLEHTIDQFVAINALKYADPIQWNIVSQYEKNTIVIDPLTGTAYISVQPVPSGVALTNTDYWTVVFDLGAFVTRAAKNFTDKWEADTTNTATFSTPAGNWLIWGDTLYKALVNITAGDSYIIDSNIEHFTMESIIGHPEDLITLAKDNLVAAINEVMSSIGNLNDLTTTDKATVVGAINEIMSNIGSLDDLVTTDKDSIVDAINEVANEVLGKIGDLNNLITTDKSNLVAAINEVANEVLGKIGDLNDLVTTDKDNLVDAINEVAGTIDSYSIANVKAYGAKGDSTTDDTAAIQAAIDSGKPIVYFPKGVYQVTQLVVDNMAPTIPMFIGEFWFNSQIRCTVNGNACIRIKDGNGANIKNLAFRQESNVNAVGVYFENNTTVRIEDCLFYNVHTGVSAQTTTSGTIIKGSMFVGNNVYAHIRANDMNDFIIDSCQFGRLDKSTYDNQRLISLSSCRNGTISNCMLWEGIQNLYMYNGDYNRIINCRFEAAGNDSIELEVSDNVIIQGCWINDNNSLNSNSPHMKIRGCNRVIIDSCIFQDWALQTTPAVHCINISDSSNYITISDCQAANYTGDMISIDASSANLNIEAEYLTSDGLTKGEGCLAYFYVRANNGPLTGDVTISANGTPIQTETLDTSAWAQQIVICKDCQYNDIIEVSFSDTARTDYFWRVVYVSK